MTFKSYSAKSKAKRALVSIGPWAEANADTLLEQQDGKWGFVPEDVQAKMAHAIAAVEGIAFFAAVETSDVHPLSDEAENASRANFTEVLQAQHADDEAEDETTSLAPDAAVGLFGNMASQITNSAPVAITKPQRQRTASAGYTIEKDRPEQNGLKRPSAGGMCRAVWDALDALRASTGAVPTVAQAKAMAPANSWNVNNVTIEFYNWRKFNGITGRAAKVAA